MKRGLCKTFIFVLTLWVLPVGTLYAADSTHPDIS
jgi:hypothetical protein